MVGRLAIGLAGLLLGTASFAAAEMQWGVNGHPITAYPGIGIDRQLDLVADLGMTSYRVNVPDDGSMDIIAELVAEGKARGIEILPILTPGDIDLKRHTAEQLYEIAHDFAATLAARFKDDIRVWELGNEMENHAIIQPCEIRDDGTPYPCEWGPAGGTDPLDYYGPRWEKVSAVLSGLSDGIDSVDPTLRKAIGTAGWGHTGAFERMLQDGIDWDISVWHMYGQDPEWAFKELVAYGKPIWVTEFNNPYGSQPGEQQQVEGLRLSMERLRELQEPYAVEAAHIYELLDEDYWAPSFEAFMGLVRLSATEDGGWEPGKPKAAYHTVKASIRSGGQLRDCALADIEDKDPSVRRARYAYCLVLGRDGEPDGVASWAEALDGGEAKLHDMLLAMLRSDEFNNRNSALGLTDRQYVGLLYLLLLGRDADSLGLENYAIELASGHMSRGGVALGIMSSSEFAEKHPVLFDKQAQRAEVPPG
jgi:Domain of unknown function (DUF4214)/Glycosyl hydrolase catalytic core